MIFDEYIEDVLNKNITYDELQAKIIMSMPPYLVRYRTFNEEYTFDELVNGNIFLQCIGKQNDPFEGRFCISNEQYIHKNRKRLEQLEKIINKKIGSNDLDIAFEMIRPHMDIYTYTIRVACFATTASNLLMWSHYANSHQGFCVYYDTEKILRCLKKYSGVYLLPVIYSETMYDATENLTSFSSNLGLNPALFKGNCWEYEQEWRLLFSEYKNNKHFSKINFDGAIKRVDLGCRCTEDKGYKQIMDWCEQKNIDLYQKKLDSKSFMLDECKISDINSVDYNVQKIEKIRKILFAGIEY